MSLLLVGALFLFVLVVYAYFRPKRAREDAVLRAANAINSSQSHVLQRLRTSAQARVLVVANPASGARQGASVLRLLAALMALLDCDVLARTDLLVTRYPKHARVAVARYLRAMMARGEAAATAADDDDDDDDEIAQFRRELGFGAPRRGAEYAVIVAIGGDGSFNELMNGLMEAVAHDATRARALTARVALALLPAGSSNGVVYALSHTDDALGAMQRALCAARPHAIDLVRARFRGVAPSADGERVDDDNDDNQNNNNSNRDSNSSNSNDDDDAGARVHYAVSHVSWAVVAEHDVWQERRLRRVVPWPAARNVIASLLSLLLCNTYFVRIRMTDAHHAYARDTLPDAPDRDALRPCADDDDDDGGGDSASAVVWSELKHHKLVGISVCNIVYPEARLPMAPMARAASGELDVLVMSAQPTKPSLFSMLRMFISMHDGEHVNHSRVHYYKATRVRLGVAPDMPPLAAQGHGVVSVDGEVYASPGELDISSVASVVGILGYELLLPAARSGPILDLPGDGDSGSSAAHRQSAASISGPEVVRG